MVVLKWCMGRLLVHSSQVLQILFFWPLSIQTNVYYYTGNCTRLTIPGILLHTKIFHKCIYSGIFNSELCNEQTPCNGYNTPVFISHTLLLYTWYILVTLSYFRHQYVSFVRLYYWSTVHYLTVVGSGHC